MLKVVVFVPETHTDTIIQAMADAGAGVIGNYTHNAFITSGTGNWFSAEGSNPTIGAVGTMSKEPEAKVEMVCPEEALKAVLTAIKTIHPYETPAIDEYQLYNTN